MRRRARSEIIRLEAILCVACATLGAAFQMGGRTLQAISIFLLGWAAGSIGHLVVVALTRRAARRRNRGL